MDQNYYEHIKKELANHQPPWFGFYGLFCSSGRLKLYHIVISIDNIQCAMRNDIRGILTFLNAQHVAQLEQNINKIYIGIQINRVVLKKQNKTNCSQQQGLIWALSASNIPVKSTQLKATMGEYLIVFHSIIFYFSVDWISRRELILKISNILTRKIFELHKEPNIYLSYAWN